MKIGFFGGCFNPPTFAHINLAKMALTESKLDKIIFVPVGDFYKKKELVPAKDRYNMLKIACDKLDNIDVSDIELKIKKRLYAIDAFKLIKKNYPNDDIYFIMGADNFINIMKWKKSKELIEKYKYIILERENVDIEGFLNNNLKENLDNIILIKNSEYGDFSSSKFRKEAKDLCFYSENIVPSDVINYLEKNKLYN